MLQINDRVQRKTKCYADNPIGTVVERDEASGRIRVLWDGDPKSPYNGCRPKRTWIKESSLKLFCR